MQTFTDTKGREWSLPPLTVASLSDMKQRGCVDLWAVVQGKAQVDDDIGKLAATFRHLCTEQVKKLGAITTAGIDAFMNDEFDGDLIAVFRHALEVAVVRFFPSAMRPTVMAVAMSRSLTSILSVKPTNSADLSDAIPPASPGTSTSSGESEVSTDASTSPAS